MTRQSGRNAEFMRLDGDRKRAIETARNRLLVTGAALAATFLVIAVRLVDLTVFETGREPRDPRPASLAHGAAGRAEITDRNGIVVATSLTTASLYGDAKLVPNPRRAARALARILPDLDAADVAAKLESGRSFVWLRRQLTPDEQYAVNRLGIPGLEFQREQRRVYPAGPLFSHTVGFTDVDGNGLAGIERSYDADLRVRANPLALSLDIRVQHVLRETLGAAMRTYRARGACGLVLDVRTGEVLGLVSLPDFDPDRPTDASADQRFNRATLGIYEMGSTFKIFTTALALETGTVSLTDGFDATRPIRAARFLIRDYHPKRRWLSVPEIFMYSSNIGAAKMALAVGGDRQRAFLARLGLLQPEPIELDEVGRPLYPHDWREINTMTIAYGHGVAVSPLQLASAVAAIVDGGILRTPTLIRRASGAPAPGRRVISRATSEKMRRLMRLVVVAGTGKRARAKGYLVGGKTGTSEQVTSGGYRNGTVLSSFVGAFPMQRPRYVVLALLDRPHGTAETHGFVTGGWVAAPVVSEVVRRIAPMLDVAPVDETSRQIESRMHIEVVSAPVGGTRLAAE